MDNRLNSHMLLCKKKNIPFASNEVIKDYTPFSHDMSILTNQQHAQQISFNLNCFFSAAV